MSRQTTSTTIDRSVARTAELLSRLRPALEVASEALDYELALLGWGMRGLQHLTVQHLAVLSSADDIIVTAGATPELLSLVRGLGGRVHDLSDHYRDGARRVQVYGALAREVVKVARRRRRTVFLQYGHPMLYSRPTRMVLQLAAEKALKTIVLSGISSMDEIFAFLRLDIRERDLQVFHAEHLYQRGKQIDPQSDLLVMQPGGPSCPIIWRHPEIRVRSSRGAMVKLLLRLQTHYERLREVLLRHYPARHPVQAINISAGDAVGATVHRGTVGGLLELGPKLGYGHTLYLRARVARGARVTRDAK